MKEVFLRYLLDVASALVVDAAADGWNVHKLLLIEEAWRLVLDDLVAMALPVVSSVVVAGDGGRLAGYIMRP